VFWAFSVKYMARLHADNYRGIGGEEFDGSLHSQMQMTSCRGA
jgi:hypothetical protein